MSPSGTSLPSAAVLAGGLATRLLPLTERVPKALLDIGGEPFIAHQLRLLHARGLEHVVLCVGHLGEMIQDTIGDGSQFGLRVDYSYDGPRLLGTAGALKSALPLLDDPFFTLYGDSYLNCDYRAVVETFERSGKLALMTVFRNEGRWDTSNVEYDGEQVRAYDKVHVTERMRHIDWGLGVLSHAALIGRRALITGASQGFGQAVARAFAAEGADVTMCARDTTALAAARDAVVAGLDNVRVLTLQADVAEPGAMTNVVAASEAELGPLDILVSNAGVYGPMGPVQDVDWADWTNAISINLMGTVLACRAILPSLTRAGRERRGKIILLSGGGATRPLPNISAYSASKAAVVRFGETLAQEVRAAGVDVNSVAPGAMNTRMLDEVLAAGPERVGQAYYQQSLKQKATGGTPPEQGAALCVFLASEASDGITGRLISAVWDPWETLADRANDLDQSDIYTLRRIIPSDRGYDWG